MSPRESRAFTLVELLIVVGIIALLVAMLAPSLGRARAMASSARCKSNLKQIWEMLQDGEGGALPAPSGWASMVYGKGGSGILRCPEHTLEDTGVGHVIITDGNVQEIQGPPSARFNDQPESNSIIYTYTERESYALPVSVQCDITRPGHYASRSSLTPARGSIPAGTMVDCQFLFFDPVGSTSTYSSGSITFGAEILGIICMDSGLDATDAALGRPGTRYHTGQGARGYEMGADVVSLEDDGRTFTIHNYHSTYPGENVRILTAPGGRSSYGMNRKVPARDGRPDQLLLLDYDRVVADPDQDVPLGQMRHLSPRHLGHSNGVTVDGSVRTYANERLRPDGPVWQTQQP